MYLQLVYISEFNHANFKNFLKTYLKKTEHQMLGEVMQQVIKTQDVRVTINICIPDFPHLCQELGKQISKC